MNNEKKSVKGLKTAIIKLSGKSINEFISNSKWITAIQYLYNEYNGIVIVHGAGKTITEWADKLGHESVFVEGQRVTTIEMMEVVSAVQGGLINSQLTAKLNSSGFESVGLSGIDRKTFTAKYINKKIGFVGKPEMTGSVNWIKDLLKKNVIPVFSSVCADADGNLMNVNADVFTEVLAAALKADTVFFVSDVNGVLIKGVVKDFLTPEGINEGIKSNEITGGMIPKLNSSSELLGKGVAKIWIGADLTGFLGGYINNGTFIVKSLKNKPANLKVA